MIKVTLRIAMDPLAPFFDHFTLAAQVFYSGTLCGISSDHAGNSGHLHVLRQGRLKLFRPRGKPLLLDQPTVLFYPRPRTHRFQADKVEGADIVCASIQFGAGMRNPLVLALPELLIVTLKSVAELAPAADLLFTEAFSNQPGRQNAVNRLAEYFLVLLLRAAMKQQLVRGGVLTGLADARLANAIAVIHERPEHPWSLEELADAASMSRARFAVHFRETVGVTPFEYLADWRIGVAQARLKRGEALKIVAPSVGYASAAALNRIFSQRVGVTPTAWLAQFQKNLSDR